MFRSRNEWFAHELQAHRREWSCPSCDHKAFNLKDSFAEHLTLVHHFKTTESQLEALILQNEEPVDRVSASACPLCDDWASTVLDSKQDQKRLFLNDGKIVEPYGTLKQFRRHRKSKPRKF
jgi:hypothetical protein